MTLAEIVFPHVRPGWILSIVIGIALLFAGRRLFWFFVGAVGFIAGMQWGSVVLGKQPEMVALLFALVIGIGCALLALLLQRVAVAVAGGAVGGMFAVHLAATAGMAGQNSQILAFVIGAVLAAVLVSLLFDWALIIFSSLAGGSLLAQLFLDGRRLEIVVALILCIVGIVFQSRGSAGGSASK